MSVILLLFIGACIGAALTIGGAGLSMWYGQRHDPQRFTPEKARTREREDRLTTERMLLDDWQRRFDRAVPPPPKPKVDVLPPQYEFPQFAPDFSAYLAQMMYSNQRGAYRTYEDLMRTRSMH